MCRQMYKIVSHDEFLAKLMLSQKKTLAEQELYFNQIYF